MCRDLPADNADATGVNQLDAGTPVALAFAAVALVGLLISVFAHSATATAIAAPLATLAALAAGRAIRSENDR